MLNSSSELEVDVILANYNHFGDVLHYPKYLIYMRFRITERAETKKFRASTTARNKSITELKHEKFPEKREDEI